MNAWQPPEAFDPDSLSPPPVPEKVYGVRSIALDLPGRCNLACGYCAESSTQPARPAMSEEMLEQVWRWFREGRPADAWSVHLGSGEPLLARPLLERIDEWIRAEPCGGQQAPAVFMTTNGTLIDQATADWLGKAGWDIKVSIDGPPPVHDRWRVMPDGRGSSAAGAAAVRMLAKRLDGRVTIASVLCHGTDPSAVFEWARTLGAGSVEMLPVLSKDEDVRLHAVDLARYRAFIMDHARSRLENRASTPAVSRFDRFVLRAMGYHNRRVGCSAGRGYVGVGPDGTLYPCMRFIGLETFRLGDVSRGLDNEAVLAFQRGAGRPYDRRDTCAACWAAPLCGGGCFAASAMFDTAAQCEVYRADAAAAVWLVQQLRASDPQRLLSWLPL